MLPFFYAPKQKAINPYRAIEPARNPTKGTQPPGTLQKAATVCPRVYGGYGLPQALAPPQLGGRGV